MLIIIKNLTLLLNNVGLASLEIMTMNKYENSNLEKKLQELEERNRQLESSIGVITSRNFMLDENSDEIDLKELISVVWKGKWLIVIVTFVFSLASIFYALSLPNEYKSTVLLAPASQSSSGNLSKLAGQFGGLASLAGINIGGSGAEDKTVIAMEIIKTWNFLEKFIEDNNIQVEVFAAEGWDRNNNKLIIDSTIYDKENKKWVREFDPEKGKKAKPSSWELYEKFVDRVNINQDKTTSLVSLSVEYYSPEIAKEWADKLVVAINEYIQKEDREESLKSISYLNKKIRQTNIADMKAVFYQLIEEQTKKLMLAEVSEEYVFKTVSSSKVAEKKSSPKRFVIVTVAFIFGCFISMIAVFFRHYNKA